VVTGWEAQLARQNPLRLLVCASLMTGCVVAGVFPAPTSVGAATFVPNHVVRVHPTYFEGPWGGQTGQPATIYAKRGETIEFKLVDARDTHHTVTLGTGECDNQPGRLCERAFDINPPVIFRFFSLGEYAFYDRYAREEGRQEMGGKFVITDSPPPVPPSTTTTTVAPSTTTTTQPTATTQPPTTPTTAPSTTTTTAPTQVRPFEVPDPLSTTSTMPAAVPVTPVGGSSAPAATKDKNKDQDKGKAKGKAAGAETPTTETTVAPDALPTDVVFDPATLTPSPSLVPEVPGAPGAADVNLESSAIMNLLDGVAEEEESTDYGPLLLALGGLALVLSIGGVCVWFGRPSRFDPA
jgi:plastocyanin